MNEVRMTDEELREYEEFKKSREEKLRKEKEKKDRETYNSLVDSTVNESVDLLIKLSEDLRVKKQSIYDNFKEIFSLKETLSGGPIDKQFSHTFSNSDGTKRIILGVNTIDGYKDTVDIGLNMVRDFITSLAHDDSSRTLVDSVLTLLARDKTGRLKAQNVIQLRQLAELSGAEDFIEGIRLIEEAYQPQLTKTFIRAEIRSENGKWTPVPLNLTDV